jgi:predicted dehydrogenase
MGKLRVGVVGCGNISAIYLKNCAKVFRNLEIVALADLVPERAVAAAAEYGIARASGVDELLAAGDVEAVLNLTVPRAHYEVSRAILEAGKHAYCEKPLAVDFASGGKLVELAGARGLRIGSAPDTFLGAGLQTCRKLIDDGWIGEVVGASAFMLCGGHESWHPDPAFYYKPGGGPMFDMGPYYLHALISLIGPVVSLSGRAGAAWKRRTITSEPRYGEIIEVEVPTNVSAILDFAGGAQGTITTSFDVRGGTSHAPIEIYGSEGTLLAPDPNAFGGPVRLRRRGQADFAELPLAFGRAENSRGLGLSDMADAIEKGRPARAAGELALHALEIMEGIQVSSDSGARYAMRTSCRRPEPMPLGEPARFPDRPS